MFPSNPFALWHCHYQIIVSTAILILGSITMSRQEEHIVIYTRSFTLQACPGPCILQLVSGKKVRIMSCWDTMLLYILQLRSLVWCVVALSQKMSSQVISQSSLILCYFLVEQTFHSQPCWRVIIVTPPVSSIFWHWCYGIDWIVSVSREWKESSAEIWLVYSYVPRKKGGFLRCL